MGVLTVYPQFDDKVNDSTITIANISATVNDNVFGVMVVLDDVTKSVSSVKWNGINYTLKGSIAFGTDVIMFVYELQQPALVETLNKSVVITLDGTANMVVTGWTVNYTAGTSQYQFNSGDTDDVLSPIASSNEGSAFVDCLGIVDGSSSTITTPADQVEMQQDTIGTVRGYNSSKRMIDFATNDMYETLDAPQSWVAGAIEYLPILNPDFNHAQDVQFRYNAERQVVRFNP